MKKEKQKIEIATWECNGHYYLFDPLRIAAFRCPNEVYQEINNTIFHDVDKFIDYAKRKIVSRFFRKNSFPLGCRQLADG